MWGGVVGFMAHYSCCFSGLLCGQWEVLVSLKRWSRVPGYALGTVVRHVSCARVCACVAVSNYANVGVIVLGRGFVSDRNAQQ